MTPNRRGCKAEPVTETHSKLRGRLIAHAQRYLHDRLGGRLQQLQGEGHACIDAAGRVRDLSAYVIDINATVLAPSAMAELSKLDAAQLSLVEEGFVMASTTPRCANSSQSALIIATMPKRPACRVLSSPSSFIRRSVA